MAAVLDPEMDLTRAVVEAAMRPGGRLNTYALACCLDEMLDRGILPPSIAEAQAVLEADDSFIRRLNRLYSDEKGEEQFLGLDTMERGIMLEILAQRFAGCRWPCLGDSEQTFLSFQAAFTMGLNAVGWEWRLNPTT